MDMEIKILDLLFRRIPAERVLQQLRNGLPLAADMTEAFLDTADVLLRNYSKDEQALIYKYHVQHRIESVAGEYKIARSPLLLLICFARETLVRQGEGLACRIHWVQPWRDAYLLLGQDIFVCAYLALLDLLEVHTRRDFTWPAVLRTDCIELNQILSRGLSENHYHLNGSTQSFALSWCSLMNYPETAEHIPALFDRLLQPSFVRRPDDFRLDAKAQAQYAAFYRCRLFQRLHGASVGEQAAVPGDLGPLDEVRSDIRVLREAFGAKLPQLGDAAPDCLDYALEPEVCNFDAPYRALAGERRFLYACFQACWKNEFSSQEQHMFFLYLLLKNGFRSEMIQVNRQTGFQNFSEYQDRKSKLLARQSYHLEAYRMGLNAPLLEGNVTSLEARICPEKTPEQMLETVQYLDQVRRFTQPGGVEEETAGFGGGTWRKNLSAAEARDLPYFFVVHFPKQADKPVQPFTAACRHEQYRKDVEVRASALAKALDASPYLRARIRGIDGCSNEIGCRPEVFAPAFRFLRDFQGLNRRKNQGAWPRLAVTYHVGEDFLDIPNALRAADEAMRFFGYRRGDRLGHALALGVQPKEYYREKGCHFMIPKQERLDDLVWLIYRGREMGAPLPPALEGMLREEASVLLRDIYGQAIVENRWSISLQEYHCAMQLRGDDPTLYRRMRWEQPPMFGLSFNAYRTDPQAKLQAYRKDPSLVGMYYYYHYGEKEKQQGSELVEVDVIQEYADYAAQCQEAMLGELARKGVMIECNPSSNVLIGTFRTYENHPIFRFNNDGYETDQDRRRACCQVQVCVNTDDLGVFDTSLEFEYALLYQALDSKQRIEKRWHSCDMLRYLENLRTIGERAIFPSVEGELSARWP